MERLAKANRIDASTNSIRYVRCLSDFNIEPIVNIWSDTTRAGYIQQKRYVVETSPKIIERCILMTTDPGDIVLDPTCGSGTTAYVAEQWGRRWITLDTSRVALALARTRLMASRYPFYLLADSREGLLKESEIIGKPSIDRPVHGDMRQGFIYERVPHITLKSIANNAEIDVIWDQWQTKLEPLRASLNTALGKSWEEWEIPREAGANWTAAAKEAHAAWWEARIARQQEIDASIGRAADTEFLYDKPYEDKKTVRVAGPFTVESLSPHRVVPADVDDRPVGRLRCRRGHRGRAVGAGAYGQAAPVGGRHRLRRGGARPPEPRRLCSRARRVTASPLPVFRRGRANTWPPRAGSWKARPNARPPSSSGRSSAPSRDPI